MSDHAKAPRWTRRFRTSPHFLTAAVLIAVAVPVSFAGSASAAVGDFAGFTTTTDVGLVNDVPAQSDLTQMGRDDTNPNLFRVAWSWDSTDVYKGGNNGDACALFDTNGNKNIDYAVCAEITNGPGGTVLLNATTAWSCSDAKTDRCTNPTAEPLAGDVDSGQLNSGAPLTQGDLVTQTDPFVGGDNYPADASVEMDVLTHTGGGFLPDTAVLANVCSYPSIGHGGNANPFDCILVPAAPTPVASATLTKTPTPTVYKVAGDTITYDLVMTNTGNVDLNNAVISDPLINSTAPNYVTSNCTVNGAAILPANLPTTLQPNDVLECKPVYTITAADITAKSVPNTATGNAASANPAATYTAPTASALVKLAAFTMAKSASPTTYSHVGDTITYTLDMTNTGSVDLTNAVISDPLINSTAPNNVTSPCTVNGGAILPANLPTTLHPGDVLECKPTYSIKLADINAGSVNNTATGTGTPPVGAAFTHTATATVNFLPAPGFTMTKSAKPTTYTNVGDQITYDLTMTNTGNTDLTNAVISDPLINPTVPNHVTSNCTVNGTAILPANLPTTLHPADVLECKPVYSITAADIGAGHVTNVATGSGVTPAGAPITHTGTATVNFVAPPPPPPPVLTPNLTLAKSSVPAAGGTVKPGDTVTYTLSYANTGTGVANTVVSSDPLPTGVTFTSADNGGTYDAASNTVSWALNNVAAGATGTVSFVVTVASTVTQGQAITNVGTIAAAGVNPVQSNPDTVTVDIPATPTLSIVKQVDSTVAEYGDTLTYTFTVSAGGADQTGVVTTDQVPDGTQYVPASATCSTGCNATETAGIVSWNIGDMAVGDTVTLTFQVTISKPTPAADGGIPPETVTNFGAVSSATVDPVDSNLVKTQVVAVLGISKKPPVKPTPKPEPSPLPFTGLPFPLLQTLVLSTVMIVAGLWLTRPRRRRPLA